MKAGWKWRAMHLITVFKLTLLAALILYVVIGRRSLGDFVTGFCFLNAAATLTFLSLRPSRAPKEIDLWKSGRA